MPDFPADGEPTNPVTPAPSVTPDATTPATSSGQDTTRETSPETTAPPAQPASMADAIAAAFDEAVKIEPAKETAPAQGETVPSDATADTPKLTGEEPGTDKTAATETPDDASDDTTAEGTADIPDPTSEELAAMAPGSRRRIRQLLDQRKTLRHEISSLSPDATGYRTIRQFMAKNELADQEVAELFQLGADLKSGDPARLQAFVDRVMPRVQQALEATGRAIPTDLQARVDTGEMTEDAAQEMARLRHARTHADQRAQASQKQAQTAATTQVRGDIQQAVLAWHNQVRQSDPDFDLKTDVMHRVAQAIVAERGHPTTSAQAVEFAKLAHDEATRLARQFQPQKIATRPTPNTTTASANRSGVRPAPQSLADAIGHAFDTATRGN